MSENWEDEMDLADGDDQVFRLSASSVKTHKGCPKRFELSYIDNLPSTKRGKGYGEVGTAVHESVESIIDKHPDPPRYQNQTRQALVSKFQGIDPDVGDDLWDRGMNCIETAAKYLTHEAFASDWLFDRSEEEFFFTLGRPDIQAGFKGYIDAVAFPSEEMDPEEGIIVDWKTGSVREEGEVIQGAVYMRGYQELYGCSPEKILFVYLKEGKERVIEPTDETWQEMLNHARNVIQDIKRGEFEADPDESKCFWCDYEMYCGASPVGAGAVDYMKFKRRRMQA